jgi:C_GCAxxG_C_C family probable redox protein
MNRSDAAAEDFKKGFNCSQAVLAALSGPLGLDRKRALKISQSFGGGMARMGLTCGAVTGALMVIGLKYGRTRPEDEGAKEKTYALVRDFVGQFKAKHGSIVCNDLIGADMSTAEGHDQAAARGVFEHVCPKYVRDAVEILKKIL